MGNRKILSSAIWCGQFFADNSMLSKRDLSEEPVYYGYYCSKLPVASNRKCTYSVLGNVSSMWPLWCRRRKEKSLFTYNLAIYGIQNYSVGLWDIARKHFDVWIWGVFHWFCMYFYAFFSVLRKKDLSEEPVYYWYHCSKLSVAGNRKCTYSVLGNLSSMWPLWSRRRFLEEDLFLRLLKSSATESIYGLNQENP